MSRVGFGSFLAKVFVIRTKLSPSWWARSTVTGWPTMTTSARSVPRWVMAASMTAASFSIPRIANCCASAVKRVVDDLGADCVDERVDADAS